jgi:hypothetical protein
MVIKHKTTYKWYWKMDYCKKNGLSPALEKSWKEAGEAYDKKHGTSDNKQDKSINSVWE